MHGPMDEVDRLADKILDAFEDIPQLRLKRLMVPDERRRGSIREMEVAATGTSFASRGIEVRAEFTVPVEDIRDSTINELGRFFALDQLVERDVYGCAVAEVRVIGETATRGVPAPAQAQKNRGARPPMMEVRANRNYLYFDGVGRGQGGRGRADVAPRERLGRGRVGRPALEEHALEGDRFYEKGLIGNPKSKAKSVVLAEKGRRTAEEAFRRLFTS